VALLCDRPHCLSRAAPLSSVLSCEDASEPVITLSTSPPHCPTRTRLLRVTQPLHKHACPGLQPNIYKRRDMFKCVHSARLVHTRRTPASPSREKEAGLLHFPQILQHVSCERSVAT